MSDDQLLILTLALVFGGIVALGIGSAIAREEIKEYTVLRRTLRRSYRRGLEQFATPAEPGIDLPATEPVTEQAVRLSGLVEYMRALPSPADAVAHRSRAAACFVAAALAFLLAAALAGVDRLADAVDDCPATSTTIPPTSSTTLAPSADTTVPPPENATPEQGGSPASGEPAAPGGNLPAATTSTTVC